MKAKEKLVLPTGMVYKAARHLPAGLSGGEAWTPDLHLALYRTAQLGEDGQLYAAQCHEGLRSAIHRVEGYHSFWELWPQLEQEGLEREYQRLAGDEALLQSQFHRPASIHGISHMKRVLLHALFLSFLLRLPLQDRRVLLYAAAYHDIGRQHDALCERHGADSVEKLHLQELQEALTPEDLRTLTFIMQWHCIADNRGLQALAQLSFADPERTRRLFLLFKDCDALDRVRILDLDFRYLRCKQSRQLALVAYQLLHHLGELEQEFLL